MKNFTISLTSIGTKALGVFLTSCVIILTIIFYMFKLPWYGCFFLTVVSLLLLLGCFLFFNHKIVLIAKQKKLRISLIKTKVIKLEELFEIRVNKEVTLNSKKYCYIDIILLGGDTIKIGGYSSLFSNNAVKITEQKINKINEMIKSTLINK